MSFSALILMAPQLIFFNMFHLVNFCIILTFLFSRYLKKFIDLDTFQEVVDFGHSFCFLEKKLSYCGTFDTLDLIPLGRITLHLFICN